MEQHEFLQGSQDWHQHRRTHFNASDAPAMLGISQYRTRSKLLHEIATGITPEIDADTKRRFKDGHIFEALARPLAEKIIGKKLYPVIGSEGKLSASFDGLTADDSTTFEHKTLNNGLRNAISSGEIPEQYRVQLEQQLMVSGADKCLFMASAWKETDEVTEHFIETEYEKQYYELTEEMHQWYEGDPALRERIVAGWAQFERDLAEYQPVEHAEKPRAEVCIELPALFIHAKGQITDSNMQAYGEALAAKLAEVRAIQLVTDQDFSNAKEAAKLFREQCKKLELTKEAMLSQTVTIGEAARMMDAWHEDLRVTALELEKKVEREDLAKKRAMVSEAGAAFSAYIEALEAETRPIQLNVPRPDFAEAIKKKRNYTSMQGALDDALAQGKIDADAIAKDIRAKLTWCKETSSGFGFLFNDLQQIITKPIDDFTLVVTTRIEAHKAAEAKKEEDLRAKVQAEEAAKLESERARMQAEEEVKARAKVEAEERAKLAAELASKPVFGAEQAQIEAIGGHVAAIDTSPKPVEKVAEIRHIKPSRPSDDQIIAVLSDHYRVHESKVIEWLLDVDLRAASERMAKEFA